MYLKQWCSLHDDLSFVQEKLNYENMKSLFVSVVCSYIKKLGQAISHGIVLGKILGEINSAKMQQIILVNIFSN